MSATDDAPGDMTGSPRQRRLRPLDDADVVALLHGAAPYERPDLEGAADLVTALRSLSDDVPAPSPALAALLRDGFSPGAVTAPAADVPVVAARPGARRVLVRLAGVSVAAKVLVGTGVAFAGVAAAAGGGVLPQVVSDRFTRIVEIVTPDPAQPAEVPPLAPAPLEEDGRPGDDGRPADADLPPRTSGDADSEAPARAPERDGQRPGSGTGTGPARPDSTRDRDGRGRDDEAREPRRGRDQVEEPAERRDERAPDSRRSEGPREDDRDEAPRPGGTDRSGAEPGDADRDAGDRDRDDAGREDDGSTDDERTDGESVDRLDAESRLGDAVHDQRTTSARR